MRVHGETEVPAGVVAVSPGGHTPGGGSPGNVPTPPSPPPGNIPLSHSL